jgi:hypothetical protein
MNENLSRTVADHALEGLLPGCGGRSVSYQQRLSGGELDRYQELLAVLVRIEQRLDVLER